MNRVPGFDAREQDPTGVVGRLAPGKRNQHQVPSLLVPGEETLGVGGWAGLCALRVGQEFSGVRKSEGRGGGSPGQFLLDMGSPEGTKPLARAALSSSGQ